MPTKKKLIERWKNVERVLKNLSPHERAKHFDMKTWGHSTACGTVACAAGHCSLDPWFQENGFRGELKADPYAYGERSVSFNGAQTGLFGYAAMRRECVKFFGAEGSDEIFLNDEVKTVDEVLKLVRKHIRTLSSNNPSK